MTGGLHFGDYDLNSIWIFAIIIPVLIPLIRLIYRRLSRWSEGRTSIKYDEKPFRRSRYITLLKVFGLTKENKKRK